MIGLNGKLGVGRTKHPEDAEFLRDARSSPTLRRESSEGPSIRSDYRRIPSAIREHQGLLAITLTVDRRPIVAPSRRTSVKPCSRHRSMNEVACSSVQPWLACPRAPC